MFDVKSKNIVALEVTSEKVGDTHMAKPLMAESMLSHPVARELVDDSYDARINFTFRMRKEPGGNGAVGRLRCRA